MKDDFKAIGKLRFIYVPIDYPGPIALDATPSKECKEYHENSCVQINMGDKVILKKIES